MVATFPRQKWGLLPYGRSSKSTEDILSCLDSPHLCLSFPTSLHSHNGGLFSAGATEACGWCLSVLSHCTFMVWIILPKSCLTCFGIQVVEWSRRGVDRLQPPQSCNRRNSNKTHFLDCAEDVKSKMPGMQLSAHQTHTSSAGLCRNMWCNSTENLNERELYKVNKINRRKGKGPATVGIWKIACNSIKLYAKSISSPPTISSLIKLLAHQTHVFKNVYVMHSTIL